MGDIWQRYEDKEQPGSEPKESSNRLLDDAYKQPKGPEPENPYSHLEMAHKMESAKNIGGATIEYKAAVAAADVFPMENAKKNFAGAKAALATERNSEERRDLEELQDSLATVIAAPFDTRIELARFYARTGRFPEAQAAVDEALAKGLDPSLKDDPRGVRRLEYAQQTQKNLAEFVDRSKLMDDFSKNYDRLDVNENKSVDWLELERAKLDRSIDAQGQKLVSFMMDNYQQLMQVSDDESGRGPDTKGITKDDIKDYKKKFDKQLKEGRRER